MTDEKMHEIVTAIQGISYLEWKKFRSVIDRKFEAEASLLANKLPAPSPDAVIDSYKRSFGDNL